jgi:hypothetical protein
MEGLHGRPGVNKVLVSIEINRLGMKLGDVDWIELICYKDQ